MGRLRGPRGVDTSLRGPLHARVEGVVVLVAPTTSPGYPNHVRFAISEIATGAIRRAFTHNSTAAAGIHTLPTRNQRFRNLL
jgi:hypothetical protein